jgi:hypothetical protein
LWLDRVTVFYERLFYICKLYSVFEFKVSTPYFLHSKNLPPAPYSRLGNRLAEGITISFKSISAVVPADEYNSAFNCYLQL